MVQGPGENAGAVDIGDGLAAVFKIESHNHPSFIEPYQGAAPAWAASSAISSRWARGRSRFWTRSASAPDEPANALPVRGVVAGIGGYGNSIGIPTVGGEVLFDESYGGNPLVNVFCLGVARHDAIVKGRRRAASATRVLRRRQDRPRRHPRRHDGVGEFDDEVGREAAGGAGGRSVHGEAAARGLPRGDETGVRRRAGHGRGRPDLRDLGDRLARWHGRRDRRRSVPQRETGMTPYEIMLSESQERMLLIVKRGREAEVEAIFEKWDLHAVRIGEVTADQHACVKHTACSWPKSRPRADRRGAGLRAAVPAPATRRRSRCRP